MSITTDETSGRIPTLAPEIYASSNRTLHVAYRECGLDFDVVPIPALIGGVDILPRSSAHPVRKTGGSGAITDQVPRRHQASVLPLPRPTEIAQLDLLAQYYKIHAKSEEKDDSLPPLSEQAALELEDELFKVLTGRRQDSGLELDNQVTDPTTDALLARNLTLIDPWDQGRPFTMNVPRSTDFLQGSRSELSNVGAAESLVHDVLSSQISLTELDIEGPANSGQNPLDDVSVPNAAVIGSTSSGLAFGLTTVKDALTHECLGITELDPKGIPATSSSSILTQDNPHYIPEQFVEAKRLLADPEMLHASQLAELRKREWLHHQDKSRTGMGAETAAANVAAAGIGASRGSSVRGQKAFRPAFASLQQAEDAERTHGELTRERHALGLVPTDMQQVSEKDFGVGFESDDEEATEGDIRPNPSRGSESYRDANDESSLEAAATIALQHKSVVERQKHMLENRRATTGATDDSNDTKETQRALIDHYSHMQQSTEVVSAESLPGEAAKASPISTSETKDPSSENVNKAKGTSMFLNTQSEAALLNGLRILLESTRELLRLNDLETNEWEIDTHTLAKHVTIVESLLQSDPSSEAGTLMFARMEAALARARTELEARTSGQSVSTADEVFEVQEDFEDDLIDRELVQVPSVALPSQASTHSQDVSQVREVASAKLSPEERALKIKSKRAAQAITLARHQVSMMIAGVFSSHLSRPQASDVGRASAEAEGMRAEGKHLRHALSAQYEGMLTDSRGADLVTDEILGPQYAPRLAAIAKVIPHVTHNEDVFASADGHIAKVTGPSSTKRLDSRTQLFTSTALEKLLRLDSATADKLLSQGDANDIVNFINSTASTWQRAKDASMSVPASESEPKYAKLETMPVNDFAEQVPSPAISYPFELDIFQKQAIIHIERGDNVFVAAHTSAGKTVVAEYAIALSLRHLTRAIYTSPIKTLSNQKFRDFREQFGANEIGLMTGDVSINPEGQCLILTTEILRSMLYRGADMIRDVEWVIFDEVHYVNDEQRGVVWEEVIIMLPKHVKLVMLSATVPNVVEFAEWVGRTRGTPVYVMSTQKRPVPLQFYLCFKEQLFKVMDSNGVYQPEGYRAVNKLLDEERKNEMKQAKSRGGKAGPGGGAGRGGGSGGGGGTRYTRHAPVNWKALVKALSAAGSAAMTSGGAYLTATSSSNLLPAVVFSFSRAGCEQAAGALAGIDLSTSTEKSSIMIFFDNALRRLPPADRKLPQIAHIRDLALRGIGVHHAGLLPVLKEIVEILFAKTLIKVLFATDTFAMGVNTPTKIVLFNGLMKHDGTRRRLLNSAEFIQMSGRAGRRGKDPFGIVAIICTPSSVPDEPEVRALLTGPSVRLQSKFRLTYSMILNVLNQEDMRMEDFMRRSFLENEHERTTPEAMALLRQAELDMARAEDQRLDTPPGVSEPVLRRFFTAANAYRQALTSLLRAVVFKRKAVLRRVFPVGRIIAVDLTPYARFTIGVVTGYVKSGAQGIRPVIPEDSEQTSAPGGTSSTDSEEEFEGFSLSVLVLVSEQIEVIPPDPEIENEGTLEDGETDSTSRPDPIIIQHKPTSKKLNTFAEEWMRETPGNPFLGALFDAVISPSFDVQASCNPAKLASSDPIWTLADSERSPDELFRFVNVKVNAHDVLAITDTVISVTGESRAFNPECHVSTDLLTAAERLYAFWTAHSTPGLIRVQRKVLTQDDEKTGTLGRVINPFRLNHLTPMQIQRFAGGHVSTAPVVAVSSAAAAASASTVASPEAEALDHIYLVGTLAPLLAKSPIGSLLALPYYIQPLERLHRLNEILKALRRSFDGSDPTLRTEYVTRCDVLRRLGYIDSTAAVTLKGRVASEVNTCDALLLAEIIFDRILHAATVEEVAAILSLLVCQEKNLTNEQITLPPNLAEPYERILLIAASLAEQQTRAGLTQSREDYIRENVNPMLMLVVYEWTRGVPFHALCAITPVSEGSIVRCIMRIAETCRDVYNAAQVTGDIELAKKVKLAVERIKRDVVFAASLYLV